MDFEPVIGLEVHAQLKTHSKIFCGCSTEFGAAPNTHVCPVCLGMPGVLPVLNRMVVEYALRMALATGCEIPRESRFARKNYFYPDLPKGYQISQYEKPLAEHGRIAIQVEGDTKTIGITRIHMEEDAGKLLHDQGVAFSRVDLNRAGVPLIEIVSEPDIRSPAEAGGYLRQLRSMLRYLGICDGNMEEGSFRCDANVSIRPAGRDAFGIRTEIKNLNSFKHVEKAIRYEITRQRNVMMDDGDVVQETRLWNPDKGRTESMRGKEEAHDYRYFPDPDLLPLIIDDDWIKRIREHLPELPDAKRTRFVQEFDLSPMDADVLVSSRDLAEYFEACIRFFPEPKPLANWIMGPLLGWLNAEGTTMAAFPVPAMELAHMLKLMDDGTINARGAKIVFEEMTRSGKAAEDIVREKGLAQVSDADAIRGVVAGVLARHPDEAHSYKGGKKKLLGFFVGQVMRETKGKANPALVNQIVKEMLDT